MITKACLLDKIGGIGFDISATKEPEYKTMIMYTYGKLVVLEGQKENLRIVGVLNSNGNST